VLYYFLTKSPDWRNFNINRQRAMAEENRPKLLQQYRDRDFSACLAQEDYGVMKSMGLAVNTEQDWEQLTSSRQQREQVLSPVHAAARQLLAALANPDATAMARQLYPLLATAAKGTTSC
jgi:hypothetical protein